MDSPTQDPSALKTMAERIEWLMTRYVSRATTLLDVSRISMGKLSLNPEPTDIGALVRDVVESFTPLAEMRLSSDF